MLSRSGTELYEEWARGAQLVEMDEHLRRLQRGARAADASPEAHTAYVGALRRAGRGREADLHELHQLGRQRAELHDKETEAQQRVRSSGSSDDHRAYQEAGKAHQQTSEQWHALAKRVHAAGDNPALAYYKPSRQDPKAHWRELAQHVANHHGVQFDHDTMGFHTRAGWTDDHIARVERASTAAHEAAQAHHSKAQPRRGALTHGYGGRTLQRVYMTWDQDK